VCAALRRDWRVLTWTCIFSYRAAPPAALRCSSMPPRLRSTSASASALHNVLPEEALRVVMLALPVDARARAACVCRSWRAFLADPSLWQVLDLTLTGGVAAERVTANLVRGAVARAAGQMRVLCFKDEFTRRKVDLLLDVIKSDGAELQHVNTNVRFKVEELRVVLAAAPRLQVLSAQVYGKCADLLPVLRNDPPYGPLRVSLLSVSRERGQAADEELALARAVAAHDSLKRLHLFGVLARGVNALVDAAAERRVSHLYIDDTCVFDGEIVPALARLLQRGSLTELEVLGRIGFLTESSVLELCAALRKCRALTSLQLHFDAPYGADRRVVTELLDAAAGLPALSVLDLSGVRAQDPAAFGRALGALLSANPPRLHILGVARCGLGDEGLAPLLDGLAANTHLRVLHCEDNDPSEAWKRNRLAPALAVLAVRRAIDARRAR
jgi:hypothetical protein